MNGSKCKKITRFIRESIEFFRGLWQVLHRLFSGNDPPPVDLIRIPQFLELLIDALFKPGSKINQVSIL
jgi:hypothetical protein